MGRPTCGCYQQRETGHARESGSAGDFTIKPRYAWQTAPDKMSSNAPVRLTPASDRAASVFAYRRTNYDAMVGADQDAEHALGADAAYAQPALANHSPAVLDALSHLRVFINDHVLLHPSGRYRRRSAIANRIAVLAIMLDPSVAPSLAHAARHLGVTPAALSKIAVEFAATTGLHLAASVGVYSPAEHARCRADAKRRAAREREAAMTKARAIASQRGRKRRLRAT